jgi:flagellar hook-associated protein 1 FlgK
MGLTSAFHIGRSALTASEIGIQIAGNNLANAATPGYNRQVLGLRPARGEFGANSTSFGRGVEISDVRRVIDQALQGRLWNGVAREAEAAQRLDVFSQLEATLNELSDNDLSTELSSFFATWSEAANLIQSSGIVVQQGQKLADVITSMRETLVDHRHQLDDQIDAMVGRADEILQKIADINGAIIDAEGGAGVENGLRDQRDQLVTELSEYLDVTAIVHDSGSMDVLVGSTPIVLGSDSRGLQVERRTEDGKLDILVRVKDDGQRIPIDSGRIGALLETRATAIDDTIERLDEIASQLIFQVNRMHSTGTNEKGLKQTTSTLTIAQQDRTLALNDPANTTFADLPFSVSNGGFDVVVTNQITGAVETVRIDVDLDGIRDDASYGVQDDTSIEDVRAQLDAVDGLVASITPDGRLRVVGESGIRFSFAEDDSDFLAVAGVNAFYEGTDARDIAVRGELTSDPGLLMIGRLIDGEFVANGTALAIAELQDQSLEALADETLASSWSIGVQQVAVRTDAALSESNAASIVRESLESQRAARSGVSIDEESINLITYQRSYQGAARFLSVVDELTQTLINLV